MWQHEIRPDRVDWVFDQTEAEAQSRRGERRRVNTFIFYERMAASIIALIVGLSGIVGGLHAAMGGHDWFGGVVSTVTIGTLVVAFLRFRGK